MTLDTIIAERAIYLAQYRYLFEVKNRRNPNLWFPKRLLSKNNTIMKHFVKCCLQCATFVIFLMPCLGIAQDFGDQWQKVVQLEEEGQVKSAAAITDQIYNQAYRQNNDPQRIRAVWNELVEQSIAHEAIRWDRLRA